MEAPVIARPKPFLVTLEAGRTYFWCACGRSASQPFCDGSHKGGPFRPVEFETEEAVTISFCGCKRSGKQPRCDGTHRSL